MFYDYKRILSYNALINMLIGERGVGKTYGATKFVVDDFLKKQNEFVYLRRYKPEIKKAIPNFFTAINSNNEYPNNRLYNKGETFYCDDTKFGYAVSLATSQDLKSVNFSKVHTIIFDEFIIEDGQKKFYLKNEVFVFLNLLETIGRLRDIRVFMLSNSANSNNPYFVYFNLQLPFNNDIKLFKENTILLQYMKNEEYREAKKQTRFGKLISGTDFEDYAVNNAFINDNKDFIEKKKGSAKFSFAFIYKNETFGVWIDNSEGLVYVSNDYLKNTPYLFSTTLKDHKPNTLFINSAKKYTCWKNFIKNFELGVVRFENIKIKAVCSELIKMLLYK